MLCTILVAIVCFIPAAEAVDLTLSDAGLMDLDWHDPRGAATAIARRDVPGPGVEFDIRFTSNQSPGYSIYLGSTRYGGQGRLAGLDVSAYDNFALAFDLRAVDGQFRPDFTGGLVVGAVVYDEVNILRFKPEVIDMGRYYGQDKTSVTYFLDVPLDGLAFHAHMFTPTGWDPAGNTITLLVKPAGGAVQVPEPASLLSATLFCFAPLARTGRPRRPVPVDN